MDLRLLKNPIHNFLSSIWSHRIVNAVLKGIAIYFILAVIFAVLYLLSDSLVFKSAPGFNTVNFLDYIYFSAVTFTTIGYGDIIPRAGAGQVIVLLESCLELIFIPVFGGYLAYKFLQRPKDILLTDNFFIRYRSKRIFLSSRVANKGKNLIDCTATVEFIQIAKNIKRTLYKREIDTPLVELTWFLEIRLDGAENAAALQQFKILMANPDTSLIRTTVSGYDSGSGNLVHVFKYYTMDKLIYGGNFFDVYTWDGVKRSEPDWTNFNKVVGLTSDERKQIDELLG